MKTLKKYDRAKLRTPQEVEQKYNLEEIENNANEVQKMRKELDANVKNVNESLANMNKSLGDKANKEDVTNSFNEVNKSIDDMNTSLEDKVDKVTGKGLSSNDFTNDYIEEIEENTTNRHTHNNKSVLDEITSGKIEIWDNAGNSITRLLSNYAVDDLEILRSSCEVKNNRVCINFVGTLSIDANTTTPLFNLPSDLCPIETRDFIVFGQSSNTTGYIGYGYITPDGLLEVRFNNDITSYIRFSFTYDIY